MAPFVLLPHNARRGEQYYYLLPFCLAEGVDICVIMALSTLSYLSGATNLCCRPYLQASSPAGRHVAWRRWAGMACCCHCNSQHRCLQPPLTTPQQARALLNATPFLLLACFFYRRATWRRAATLGARDERIFQSGQQRTHALPLCAAAPRSLPTRARTTLNTRALPAGLVGAHFARATRRERALAPFPGRHNATRSCGAWQQDVAAPYRSVLWFGIAYAVLLPPSSTTSTSRHSGRLNIRAAPAYIHYYHY